MSEVAIRVDNVSKDFKIIHSRSSTVKSLFTSLLKNKPNQTVETQQALKSVSFEVKEGEFFGILGRNGSGKSTLLKMLAGIYQPTKGKIQVKGKLVPFIELGVGFNPELTGRENVYLNGALLGFSESEVSDFYDEVVGFAELERFMDKKLKNYSSGMQVRLAFSMAVRAKADILLIDEVLAVGDADFQRKCFDYFKKLKKNKKTVVFVSHDMTAVREYCDRSMLIEDSEILKIGPTDKVAEMYTRLFTEKEPAQESHERPPDDQDRWGNGAIKTSKVSVKISRKEITITQNMVANIVIDRPVVGFSIRDAAGSVVTGTNNRIEKIETPTLDENEHFKIEWRIPNILSDGSYSVSPAILMPDGITVADWWNDATTFSVRKGRHIPYAIDCGYGVTILSKHKRSK